MSFHDSVKKRNRLGSAQIHFRKKTRSFSHPNNPRILILHLSYHPFLFHLPPSHSPSERENREVFQTNRLIKKSFLEINGFPSASSFGKGFPLPCTFLNNPCFLAFLIFSSMNPSQTLICPAISAPSSPPPPPNSSNSSSGGKLIPTPPPPPPPVERFPDL